ADPAGQDPPACRRRGIRMRPRVDGPGTAERGALCRGARGRGVPEPRRFRPGARRLPAPREPPGEITLASPDKEEVSMHKLIVGVVLAAASAVAVAQAKYPQRTVEVVVPYAPGGGTDNLMRMITGIIDENKWSPVPLNVNNRAGGSGAVGFSYLINKKGDPHVIAGATPMIVSGKIEGRLPGDHRDAMTILMI